MTLYLVHRKGVRDTDIVYVDLASAFYLAVFYARAYKCKMQVSIATPQEIKKLHAHERLQ